MGNNATGLMQYPEWVRGQATIADGRIILDQQRARRYHLYDLEFPDRMPVDLANLWRASPEQATDFVERYGLLWHGPEKVGSGGCSESLRDWKIAAHDLSITIHLHNALRLSIDLDSIQPVRDYLVSLRDLDLYAGYIPTATEEWASYISVVLGERITRGLNGCSWSFVAACGLKRDGEAAGRAGEFFFGERPSNLVAAAYAHFASAIINRHEIRECDCGVLFRPDHPRQVDCTKRCGQAKRKRRERSAQQVPAPPA